MDILKVTQPLNQIIKIKELKKNSVKRKELEKHYDAQTHTHKKTNSHENVIPPLIKIMKQLLIKQPKII